MDVREKLVELLNGVQHYGTICTMSQMDDRYASITQVSNKEVAEGLIAHGVTVQEWISVNDPPGKKGCYLVTVKHWCDGKPVTREAYYTISGWISCEKGVDITSRVTHWQYLPQPPKGE